MGFSRQEYCSGLLCPPPRDLPNPGIEIHLLHCRQILYRWDTEEAPVCSISSVQFSSVAQSCLTLCDPVACNTPGFPVHHQLPELAQTHVHRLGDAIQPSHPLSPPSPPAFNLSQHQSLLQWVGSSHQVAKVFCSYLLRLFHHEWILDFVKRFLFIYWYDYAF